jgi:hypothetical protein
MKNLAIAILLSAALAFAADVTGNWAGTVHATKDDGSTSSDQAQFKLKQEGTKLTGTGGGLNDSFPIENGKVEGDTITLDLVSERGVYKLTLKLEGDTMTGDVKRDREGKTQVARLSLKREQ